MIGEEPDLEQFNNFYFIVFEPNPRRKNVKVLFDGEVTAYYSLEQFLEFIQKVCPNQFYNCKDASHYYGDTFLIDRVSNSFKKLQFSSKEENIKLLSKRDVGSFAMKKDEISTNSLFDYMKDCTKSPTDVLRK